ncbi:hypothetical protein BpHYR1_006143 [Brachionus plicatilis]|uniref:Uncharacterized protein n=1 Tax=Brachionus plicatilis TaxID=10195 RepID=A0A3M7RVM0_BRAPC|nr:hypothetical protein BpHYR1_006143 [Brachionus plicatilis]
MNSKRLSSSVLRVRDASTQCDFPPLFRLRKFYDNKNYGKKLPKSLVKKTPSPKNNRKIVFSKNVPHSSKSPQTMHEIPYNLRSRSNRPTASSAPKRFTSRSNTPVKTKRVHLSPPDKSDYLFEKKEAFKLRNQPELYRRGNKFTLYTPDMDEVDPDQVDGGVNWEQLDLNNPFGDLDMDQMDLNRLLILGPGNISEDEADQSQQQLLPQTDQTDTASANEPFFDAEESNNEAEEEQQPIWEHLDLNALYGRQRADSESGESNQETVWEHLDLNKLYGLPARSQEPEEPEENEWDLSDVMNATWGGSNNRNLPSTRNVRVPMRKIRPRKKKHPLLPRQRRLIEPNIRLDFSPPLNPNIDEALQYLRDNRPMNTDHVDPEVEYFNFRMPLLRRNANDNSMEALLKAKLDQLKRMDTQIYVKLHQACKLRRIQEIKERILNKIERRMSEIDDLMDKNDADEKDAFNDANRHLSVAQRNAKWLEYLSRKEPPRMNFLNVDTRRRVRFNNRERIIDLALENYIANYIFNKILKD